MPVDLTEDIPLPSSPNALHFELDTRHVLADPEYGWRATQQTVADVLERFHQVSGFDAGAWLHLSDALDRRNKPVSRLAILVVIDAPATRAHLAAIDGSLAATGLPWVSCGVQSVPQDAFPSLCLHHGRMYQVWLRDRDGHPWMPWLDRREGRLERAHLSPDQVGPEDGVEGVRHAFGTDLAPDDQRLTRKQQLMVAFAMAAAQEIVEADGIVEDDETAFLERVFPSELIERLGLTDPAACASVGEQARLELPRLLGYHEKLALIGLFFSAVHADGRMDVRELKALKRWAEQLGISGDEVVSYWRKLW